MIRKEKGRVDVYGDRFRARAHQLTPRLLQVARYIHDNREAVMEQTAMEIAAVVKTSDATVVRAIQALGFAGLRDLKQTLEQWFAPDTARGLDAFIEGMTLHFVTDRAPLSKAAIRMMVGQLAGERAQEEGR